MNLDKYILHDVIKRIIYKDNFTTLRYTQFIGTTVKYTVYMVHANKS